MTQFQIHGSCLEVEASGTAADLNLSFGPESICVKEQGGADFCLPRGEVATVKVSPHNAETLIKVDQHSDLNTPLIEIGPTTREVILYGDTANVRVSTSTAQTLVVRGASPESIVEQDPQIASFHTAIRQHKNWLGRLQEKVLEFVGRDMKLGISSWSDIVRLGEDLFHGKSLHRMAAEFFARRRHIDVSPPVIAHMKELLQPGDIVFRYQKGYPFDKYVVGIWQHVGVCVDSIGSVIDAIAGEGVAARPIERFAHADAVAIVRPNLPGNLKQEFLNYVRLQVGKAYNYSFSADPREHYCSGLIHHALEHCGLLKRRTDTVHPDELLKIPNLSLVWTNRPDLVAAVAPSTQPRKAA